MARSSKTIFNGSRAPNTAPYRRTTKRYPSKPDSGCNTTAVSTPKYTGTYVKGVALLHKQAYAPVTTGEQAKDIAKMRRN